MSLGKQKNLIIVAAVAAGLLAGTVLLASYTDILPRGAKNCGQTESCPSAAGVTCAKSQGAGEKFPTVCASGKAVMASAETAESCCAKEGMVEDLCPCGKPAGSCIACAEEPTGCCSEKTAGACCAKPKAAESCCPGKAEAAAE
ncbi:MAG: hypothetical protein ACYSWO_18390 [Planctomycetota bacterium]